MRKQVKRGITLVLLCGILALSICACGSSGNAGTSGSSEPAATEETQAVEAQAEETQDAEAQAEETQSAEVQVVEGQEAEAAVGDIAAEAAREASLDPSVVYKEEEETIIDSEGLSVVVTGYDPEGRDADGNKAFTVKLRCENKTQEDVNFGFLELGVNRFFSHNWSVQGDNIIPAGETVEQAVTITNSCLVAAGISSVDEIIGGYDAFSVESGSGLDEGSFSVYPTGLSEEEVVPVDPITEEDYTVLTDNDHFLMGVLKNNEKTAALYSYDQHNNEVLFYMASRRGKSYELLTDSLFINGVDYLKAEFEDDEPGIDYLIHRYYAFSDCVYLTSFWLDDKFLEENQIGSYDDITEMTIGLKAEDSPFVEPFWMDLVTYNTDESNENVQLPKYAKYKYNTKLQCLWENDYLKVAVDGIQPYGAMRTSDGEYKKAFRTTMYLQNLTDYVLHYSIGKRVSVNNIDGFGDEDIETDWLDSGRATRIILYIPADELEDKGIEAVEQVKFSIDVYADRDESFDFEYFPRR